MANTDRRPRELATALGGGVALRARVSHTPDAEQVRRRMWTAEIVAILAVVACGSDTDPSTDEAVAAAAPTRDDDRRAATQCRKCR
jgi:hypothetical protein